MKKHKFTWIDGLVIAVAVLLIAGTCVKFLLVDKTDVTRQTVPITYQIQIQGVRQFTVDALQVGDTVYEKEGKGAVGVIENVTVEPGHSAAPYPDGTARDVTMEDRYDVTVTISADAVLDGSVYRVGVYGIRVGHEGEYFTKYSIWHGTVSAIFGADS